MTYKTCAIALIPSCKIKPIICFQRVIGLCIYKMKAGSYNLGRILKRDL